MTSSVPMATDVGDIPRMVQELRQHYREGAIQHVDCRRAHMLAVKRMVEDNQEAIIDAIASDLGRPRHEIIMATFADVLSQVRYLLSTLEAKAQPTHVKTPVSLETYGRWKVRREPLGVVLIIAPWNYPFNLVVNPLLGALATGNVAIIKPSEVSARTAAIIAELVPRYLDSRAVRVVLGGVPETTALLEQRFDLIFFTGSIVVGRIIAMAAAKHLTPTVLELGGKNPVFVHQSADVEVAARRILWGKLLNCGQMCMAPDYVLVDRGVLPQLLNALRTEVAAMFGEDPKCSTSLGRIVNTAHVDRLAAMLQEDHGGEVIFGGTVDRDAKFVAPTVVLSPRRGCKMLTDEIFGPILPVIPLDGGIDEAVEHVNGDATPLSAYLFADDRAVHKCWEERVSAGNMCINDILGQYMHPECPFGGKGESGMGSYRGAYSIDAFFHLKTVATAYTGADFLVAPKRYAPYTPEKTQELIAKVGLRPSAMADLDKDTSVSP